MGNGPSGQPGDNTEQDESGRWKKQLTQKMSKKKPASRDSAYMSADDGTSSAEDEDTATRKDPPKGERCRQGGDSSGRTIGESDKFYVKAGAPAFATTDKDVDESEESKPSWRPPLAAPNCRWSRQKDLCLGSMEGCQDELLVDVVGPDDDMTQPRRGHLGSRPGSLEDTIDKIERSRARILRLLNQENAEEDFQESGPGAHLTDARNRWRITGCLRRAWVEEEVSEDSARLLNEHGRQGIETRASEEQEKRQENACAGESSIFQCPPPRTQEDHRVEGFFFGPDPPSLSKITTCQLALAPRRTREECVASILSKYIYIEQEKTPKAYLRGYIALISGVVARFAYSGFNRRTTNSTVLTPIRSYVVMTLSVHSGEEAKKTERKKPAAAGGSGWKRHNYVGNTLSVQNIPVEEAKVEKVTPAPPPTPNEAWKFRKYLSCISVWSSRDRVVDWLNNLPEFVPSGSRLLDALAPRLKPRTGSGERVETPLSSDSQPEEERLMRELDDCPQPDDDTEWSDVDR